MNSKNTLQFMINLFSQYLDELYTTKDNEFVLGEITAYTECLEIISDCGCIDKKEIERILNKKR